MFGQSVFLSRLKVQALTNVNQSSRRTTYMSRLKNVLLAAACMGLAAVTQAQAGPVTYSGYSVLNNQTVTLNGPSLGIRNKATGSGQITLTGANVIGGSIATWCIDILHQLNGSGQFTTGTFLSGALGDKVNALLTHVIPILGTSYDSSSALQVAIWRVEYGPKLAVAAPAGVSTLADDYVTKVNNGAWIADPARRVAVLAGGESNQSQAYLVAVPEPASMVVVLGSLVSMGLLRRKQV